MILACYFPRKMVVTLWDYFWMAVPILVHKTVFQIVKIGLGYSNTYLSFFHMSCHVTGIVIGRWGIPGQIDQRLTPSYFKKI